jgi:hypothetical protein
VPCSTRVLSERIAAMNSPNWLTSRTEDGEDKEAISLRFIRMMRRMEIANEDS